METTGNKNFFEREVEVLSSAGLGAADAAALAWADVKSGVGKLIEQPIAYASEFVRDHWQEPVMGAAMAMLAPRGLAKAAILVYSGRDLLESTYKAAVGAADKNANLEELSRQYRQSIGLGGASFVESLPLTALGGTFGRAAANAVVGPGLGAWDLASRTVPFKTVKHNCWQLHDEVSPPATKLAVFDLDNTLYPYSKALATGYKTAIADLSAKTGLEEGELYSLIGREVDRVSNFSYPWTLELALSDRLQVGKPHGMSLQHFETHIANPFWATLEQSMTDNGKAFPQAVPTLRELSNRKIPAVVLTNATSNGVRRLQNMGMADGSLLRRMYAIENRAAPDNLPADLLDVGKQRGRSLFPKEHGLEKFVQFPKEWMKPDPRGLQTIIEDYGLRPRQVLMIGDSASNDMAAAQRAGTRGVWVRHAYSTPELEAVLSRLSEEAKAKKAPSNNVKFTAVAPQFAEVDSLTGVIDHLQPKPNYRAIAHGIGRSVAIRPEIATMVGGVGLLDAQSDLEYVLGGR